MSDDGAGPRSSPGRPVPLRVLYRLIAPLPRPPGRAGLRAPGARRRVTHGGGVMLARFARTMYRRRRARARRLGRRPARGHRPRRRRRGRAPRRLRHARAASRPPSSRCSPSGSPSSRATPSSWSSRPPPASPIRQAAGADRLGQRRGRRPRPRHRRPTHGGLARRDGLAGDGAARRHHREGAGGRRSRRSSTSPTHADTDGLTVDAGGPAVPERRGDRGRLRADRHDRRPGHPADRLRLGARRRAADRGGPVRRRAVARRRPSCCCTSSSSPTGRR